MGLLKFLKRLKTKKEFKAYDKKSYFPAFRIDKHYNDMSRRERREYKRWLVKNDIWDGAVVLENLERNKKLHFRK